MTFSIGEYLSLISKIKNTVPVNDIFQLGGRYFSVAAYSNFDKKTQAKLDVIYEDKNIDVEKLRLDMLSFYQQQNK